MKKINNIIISANPTFIPEQSDLQKYKFIWAYEISISNNGDEIFQLLNRYWRIVDMSGRIEEIRGAGVIGLQPLIKPGKKFVYTSFCQLTTPQGTMEGNYELQNLNEEHFEAEIPKFILSAPTEITKTFRSRLH